MVLVNDQLNAQILVLKQVYFISLNVSNTIVLIIRRSKITPVGGHLQSVTIPDAI